VLLCCAADVLQEIGSITQLKTVSPKIFNKTYTWDDGTRLQDLFPYEFRLLRENIQVPGRLQELHKQKVCALAASVTSTKQVGVLARVMPYHVCSACCWLAVCAVRWRVSCPASNRSS
jgi:hypothetical protein